MDDKLRFAFAIDCVDCYTCNDNWEQSILDRNKPENADLPLKKFAILKGISLYSFIPSSEELIQKSELDYMLEQGNILYDS